MKWRMAGSRRRVSRGEGCSISLASAFIMTDAIKGKELNETLRMAEQFSQMMQGEMVEF